MTGSSWDWLSGTLAVPFWGAGAFAAGFVFVLSLAVRRLGIARAGRVLAGGAVVLVAALLGSSVLDQLAQQATIARRQTQIAEAAAQDAERRALDDLARELARSALAPGSALACLDAGAGEMVEAACEKSVFASAEAVAAAVAYISERLKLIADGLDYARRVDPGFAATVEPWRRAAEADRYGVVAQVLARSGCTADACDAFALLRDPSAVKNNLRARTFDGLVAQYSEHWKTRPSEPGPVATAEPPPAHGALPVVRHIDFPSSASIPPVSIMDPEPSGPPGPTTGSAAPPGAPPAPAKRPPGAADTLAGAAGKRPPPPAARPQPNPWSGVAVPTPPTPPPRTEGSEAAGQ